MNHIIYTNTDACNVTIFNKLNKSRLAINQIPIYPWIIARLLGIIASLLIVASLSGQLLKTPLEQLHLNQLISFFNLDGEHNAPTFFSVLLMVTIALILAIIAILNDQRQQPYVLNWSILSIWFLMMAFDEAFSLHERLNEPLRQFLGNDNLGCFYFTWVIPAIILVFVFAMAFMRFLLHLSSAVRRNMMMAALVYLGGVIGIELIGGGFAEKHGTESLIYNIITTVEESLEMAGLIMFIYALLSYIADNYTEIVFRFSDCGSNK